MKNQANKRYASKPVQPSYLGTLNVNAMSAEPQSGYANAQQLARVSNQHDVNVIVPRGVMRNLNNY